jgi:hypothetical protein
MKCHGLLFLLAFSAGAIPLAEGAKKKKKLKAAVAQQPVSVAIEAEVITSNKGGLTSSVDWRSKGAVTSVKALPVDIGTGGDDDDDSTLQLVLFDGNAISEGELPESLLKYNIFSDINNQLMIFATKKLLILSKLATRSRPTRTLKLNYSPLDPSQV